MRLFVTDHFYPQLREMKKDSCMISMIGIPTCGRPVALERCLVGILKNLADYGRTLRIVVADSSTEALHASQNRMIVNKVNMRHDSEIEFIGDEEKALLLEKCTLLGVDRRVSEFAISGLQGLGLTCVGANRNVLLLAAAGASFISVDDDTQAIFADCRQFGGGDEYRCYFAEADR